MELVAVAPDGLASELVNLPTETIVVAVEEADELGCLPTE